jgi:hypothetical protein
VGVFDASEDAGKYCFLLHLLEDEIELFKLFADETYSQDGDLLDCGVLVFDVVSDFLDDSRPLVLGQFDAADGCNDLGKTMRTLAAALRMSFSGSIMVLRTMSLKADLLGGVMEYQR